MYGGSFPSVSVTVHPVNQTVTFMIIVLIVEKQSKSQLMSAFATAANKNISKGSLSATAMLSPQSVGSSPHTESRQSPEDDGGFRNRDLAQEVIMMGYSILIKAVITMCNIINLS